MQKNESAIRLNDTVISNGYCIGCGACSMNEGSPFKIIMTETGQYQAELAREVVGYDSSQSFTELCPFSDDVDDETEIGNKLYGRSCSYNSDLGFYNGTYAGFVSDMETRNSGSSGGMGSWLLEELFSTKRVDYVINVKAVNSQDADGRPLFEFTVADSIASIKKNAKSRYYPVEMSKVLKYVKNTPGRYAITGLPCFIKAIRLLQQQDPILEHRIKFCIGLVCGHLKSSRYAESLAWQLGIHPSTLNFIDFRLKDLDAPANQYFTFATNNKIAKRASTKNLFGTDWGAGAFKYKACDFCDDVFCETADVVVGDAWLPEYVSDSLGTNIVLSRNKEIKKIIEDARLDERLTLDDLSVEKLVASQDAGLRHRKEAIAYRLHREMEKGSWVPHKRTPPSAKYGKDYDQQRQDSRIVLRDMSHESFSEALKKNDLNIYLESMRPLLKVYLSIKPPMARRLLNFLVRAKKSILSQVLKNVIK